jgi:serine protease Do
LSPAVVVRLGSPALQGQAAGGRSPHISLVVPRLGLVLLVALASARPRADTLASLEAEQSALFDRVAPGVVVIAGRGSLGAGFAVAPGLVLTAAHVVAGQRVVQVTLRDGRVVAGSVDEIAAGDVDAALVRVPVTLPLLELGQADQLRAGSVVASIGHPDGNRWTLATGFVAQDPADSADRDVVRLQLPLRPGASGGPVVDRAGRVVAVVALGAPGTAAYGVRIEAALRSLAGLRTRVALARPQAERPTP